MQKQPHMLPDDNVDGGQYFPNHAYNGAYADGQKAERERGALERKALTEENAKLKKLLRDAVAEWKCVCNPHGWEPDHLAGMAAAISYVDELDAKAKTEKRERTRNDIC